jgi:predicted DNA-binding transcriptional regulator
MSMSFFVEFRLHGFAKNYANWARKRIFKRARELGIRKLRERRFVSHISLFGNARTNNLKRVIDEVERIGRKYSLVPFKLGIERGKSQQKDVNWLYLNIQPSHTLEQLRYELAQSLCKAERMINNTCKFYDRTPKYQFHVTLGKFSPSDNNKFDKLVEYAETKCGVEVYKQCEISILGKLLNNIKQCIFGIEKKDSGINQHLLRITVLGRYNHISCEYDLVLKKMLSRREALSRYWWKRTIEKLNDLRR